MSAYITSFGTALPKYRISQKEIAGFLLTNLNLSDEKKKETEIIFRASGISHRHSVLKDYTASLGDFEFFPNTNNLEPFPGVSQRMQVYKKEALALSLDAVQQCIGTDDPQNFTHLITVSCTGMYAPGLDFDLVKSLGLSHSIKRTAINFMGCYAAFNALKVAKDICTANAGSKVLIVCVELCSLHFQKNLNQEDTTLANALFGDGAAAVVVESNPSNYPSMSMENFHCDLLIEGEQDMTWSIGAFGFEMTLSSYVPDLVKKGIKSLINSLLHELKLNTSDISHFAIHPGGKRILEVIEQELGIPKESNTAAYSVLKNYGNMSSPTILFVLQSIFEKLEEHDKESKILGLAFGPGLTLESMLLKVC
tara:strand:- start:3 stop:1100 length:1098 start_codon:yes stop_codon:yes gene_type:complete